MKLFVAGATGLIGHNVLSPAIRRGHQVTAIGHSRRSAASGLRTAIQADLSDPDALTDRILEEWPDAIVNAAAISSPAAVDANPKLAEQLNVVLPRRLAQLSTHIGARLIHLSTDMVFDGVEGAPYRSTDLPNPSGLYGQMKLMAEREVLEHNPEDPVVLRIGIVMGNSPGGQRSVHEKMLAEIQAGGRPRLFTDEIRQPASAENIGEVVVELCERRDLHGIFHWSGSETINRFELGTRILRHFRLPEDSIEAVEMAGLPEFERRPRDLRLILEPLAGKLKTSPAAIGAIIDELQIPDHLYDWYRAHRSD